MKHCYGIVSGQSFSINCISHIFADVKYVAENDHSRLLNLCLALCPCQNQHPWQRPEQWAGAGAVLAPRPSSRCGLPEDGVRALQPSWPHRGQRGRRVPCQGCIVSGAGGENAKILRFFLLIFYMILQNFSLNVSNKFSISKLMLRSILQSSNVF